LWVTAFFSQMRARHRAEFLRTPDAGEAHEILDRVLIGAAGMGVAEVGEPFDLGRHVGELVELGGGQEPVGGRDFGRQRVGGVGGVGGHAAIVVLIKCIPS